VRPRGAGCRRFHAPEALGAEVVLGLADGVRRALGHWNDIVAITSSAAKRP
jgi:hypothetical protein